MKKFITKITALSLLLTAVPAYAELNINGETSGKTRIGTDLIQTLDIKIDGNVDSSVEAKVLPTNVEVELGATVEAENKKEEAQEEEVRTNTETQSNAVIRINGDRILEEVDLYVNSANSVNSDQDLAVFAKVTAESDSNVQAISSSRNKVELYYDENVKFLGLFDTKMKRKATVMFDANSEAEVKVSKPWWALFVTGDVAANTDIEADIENNLSSSAKASVEASARTQAEVMAAMQAAMQASVSGNVKASVN